MANLRKVKYIKEFIFDKAQYHVYDENKNRVLLKIDYKENSYEINGFQKVPEDFVKEVTDVAISLLKKKHGVNRAKYVRK